MSPQTELTANGEDPRESATWQECLEAGRAAQQCAITPTGRAAREPDVVHQLYRDAEEWLLAAVRKAEALNESDPALAICLEELFRHYRWMADYPGIEWSCRRSCASKRRASGRVTPTWCNS